MRFFAGEVSDGRDGRRVWECEKWFCSERRGGKEAGRGEPQRTQRAQREWKKRREGGGLSEWGSTKGQKGQEKRGMWKRGGRGAGRRCEGRHGDRPAKRRRRKSAVFGLDGGRGNRAKWGCRSGWPVERRVGTGGMTFWFCIFCKGFRLVKREKFHDESIRKDAHHRALLSCLVRASHGLTKPRMEARFFVGPEWVPVNGEGHEVCAMRMGQVRPGRGAMGGVWGGGAGGGLRNSGVRLFVERGGPATAPPNGDAGSRRFSGLMGGGGRCKVVVPFGEASQEAD